MSKNPLENVEAVVEKLVKIKNPKTGEIKKVNATVADLLCRKEGCTVVE